MPCLEPAHELELMLYKVAQFSAVARISVAPLLERVQLQRKSIRFVRTSVLRYRCQLPVDLVDRSQSIICRLRGLCRGAPVCSLEERQHLANCAEIVGRSFSVRGPDSTRGGSEETLHGRLIPAT